MIEKDGDLFLSELESIKFCRNLLDSIMIRNTFPVLTFGHWGQPKALMVSFFPIWKEVCIFGLFRDKTNEKISLFVGQVKADAFNRLLERLANLVALLEQLLVKSFSEFNSCFVEDLTLLLHTDDMPHAASLENSSNSF